MGSSYFPVPEGPAYDKLIAARNLVREVRDEYLERVYSGDDGQFDNAASDGGSLALLGLAARLIDSEIDGGRKK